MFYITPDMFDGVIEDDKTEYKTETMIVNLSRVMWIEKFNPRFIGDYIRFVFGEIEKTYISIEWKFKTEKQRDKVFEEISDLLKMMTYQSMQQVEQNQITNKEV